MVTYHRGKGSNQTRAITAGNAVLFYLREHPGRTIHDISESMNKNWTNVRSAVENLQNAGLAECREVPGYREGTRGGKRILVVWSASRIGMRHDLANLPGRKPSRSGDRYPCGCEKVPSTPFCLKCRNMRRWNEYEGGDKRFILANMKDRA